MSEFHVYIMASRSNVMYVGVTSNLPQRIGDHRQRLAGFTARYNVTRLVYVEATDSARTAIAREKQLKGLSRAKKIAIVESLSPGWADLAEDWYATEPADASRPSRASALVEVDSSLPSE